MNALKSVARTQRVNKIQNDRQNPRAWTAPSICFMFGLKERPYSGHELKSFWCDSDNKNFDIFTF